MHIANVGVTLSQQRRYAQFFADGSVNSYHLRPGKRCVHRTASPDQTGHYNSWLCRRYPFIHWVFHRHAGHICGQGAQCEASMALSASRYCRMLEKAAATALTTHITADCSEIRRCLGMDMICSQPFV
eukprot:3687127-Pleurochrysis_carterae.AAC.1